MSRRTAIGFAALVALLLPGCEFAIRAVGGAAQGLAAPPIRAPRAYSVSDANQELLRRYDGTRARVIFMEPPAEFHPHCRGLGPIVPDETSIPIYVQEAFNTELQAANAYANNGVSLTGRLQKLEFSSGGLFGSQAYWAIGLTLTSAAGQSLSVNSRHEFESGRGGGQTACFMTSWSLRNAVQELLGMVFADPRFPALLVQQ